MFVLVILRNEFRGTCMAAGPGLQTPHLLHCNHYIMMYHCHRMKLHVPMDCSGRGMMSLLDASQWDPVVREQERKGIASASDATDAAP